MHSILVQEESRVCTSRGPNMYIGGYDKKTLSAETKRGGDSEPTGRIRS